MIRRVGISPKLQQSIEPLNLVESIESKVTLGFSSFEEFANGCNIISEGKIKKFELFEFQLKLAKLILSGKYKVIYIVKSRQLGITLLLACILAYKAITQNGFASFLISLGQGESTKVSRRVKRFFDSWKIRLSHDNTKEQILENESTLNYYPNTSNAGRSISVNFSIYDECGFYDLRELKSASAASSIWGGDETTASVSLSTPSDKQSEFYELLSEGNPEPYELIAEKVVSGELPPMYFWEDARGALKVVIHFTAVPKFKENPELYLNILFEEGLTPEQIDRECNLKFDDRSGASSLDYQKVNAAFCLDHWVDYKILKLNGWDLIISIDPCGYGQDQMAVLILAVHTQLQRIMVLKEFYLDEPDYQEIEFFLDAEGIVEHRPEMWIELNGVGAGCYSHFKTIAPICRKIKVNGYTASEQTKLDTVAFLKWIIDNSMLEGMDTVVELKSQLKRYDLNLMEGVKSADDGVSALIHGLQFINFQQWYARKRGLFLSSGSSSLVGKPFKKIGKTQKGGFASAVKNIRFG